ncbi:MAG TPA: DUF4149 domain-containing protein [Thermomicrobiales bacterium]|nr:DUF4149 domain-containing protein [Thermomicrobiales bacterium]
MRSTGRTLLNFAFLFALAVWGGMVFFFTFVTAPAVFAGLDRDTAAKLLGDLFPQYYRVQLACVAVALVVLVARLAQGGAARRFAGAGVVLLAIALAITLYATVALLPQMQAAQARVPSFVTTAKTDPVRVAYDQLHGRAMILNAVAALLGGATLALAAFEPGLLWLRGTVRGTRDADQARAGAAASPARDAADALPARARP